MIARAFVAGLLSIFLLTGCASYRLGLPGGEGVKSIYLEPVINDSDTPQIRALLTEQLRRQFGQSAQWRLADREDAEYQLQVRITRSSQRVGATREDDTGRGLSFSTRLIASGELTLPDGTSRKLTELESDGVIFATPGQPEVAYQSLPSLSQKLAEQVYRAVSFQD